MRQFARGERARLLELAAINHLWDVEVSMDAPIYIVDFCCLGLDENGEVFDDDFVINFNRPDAPNGAIQLNNTSNNGATFSLSLELLPARVRRLVFTASLGENPLPGGLAGGLVGAAFSLFGLNAQAGAGHLILATPAAEMAFFEFSGQDFGDAPTLVLGELYWRDEWRFVAAGQPLRGQLGAFLRTLSDGPTPAPRAVAPVNLPGVAPVSAPVRPSRPSVAPPVRLAPRPVAPVLAPARASAVSPVIPDPRVTPAINASTPNFPNTKPTIRPVAPSALAPEASSSAASISIPAPRGSSPLSPAPATITLPGSTADLAAAGAAPAAVSIPVAPPNLPQSVPRGGQLQDLIEAAAPGSTLILQRGEYAGPITLSKPLALEGQGSAIWTRNGPAVTLAAPGATLHDLDIEVTAPGESRAAGVALKVEVGAMLELDNVNVRGSIAGLGASDGEWKVPRALDLGEFAARQSNEFRLKIEVPTATTLLCSVGGIEITPSQIAAGAHQVTLIARDIAPDTLVVGQIEVRAPQLVFLVPVQGSAQSGAETARGREIGG